MATDATNPCLAHGCSACCHDTEMTLTDDDVARLEARGHVRADFAWQDPEGFLVLRNVDAADGGRHCYFLRDGRCSVYADRPRGCKLYPFILHATTERVIRDGDCPHRAEFPAATGTARRLQLLWRTTRDESADRRRRGA